MTASPTASRTARGSARTSWIVVGILLASFVGLGFTVALGKPTTLDIMTLRREILSRNDIETTIAKALDVIGGMPVIVLIAAVILIGLDRWLGARWRIVGAGAVVMAGHALLVQVAKVAVGRSRPPEVWRLEDEVTASFPSGHSAATSALAVFVVLVLASAGVRGWRIWMAGALAGTCVVVMAGSRTYLGVHWLTDVVAGALLGAACAVATWELMVRGRI